MSTTSTVVAFRSALVAAIEEHPDRGDLQVKRRWPGPDTEGEGIFLGNDRGTSEIASVKAGRQHRNEVYEIDVILQSWTASETPDTPELAEIRLDELHAIVEDVLADEPNVGGVQWSAVSAWETTVEPFGPGWRGRRTVTLTATARLT